MLLSLSKQHNNWLTFRARKVVSSEQVYNYAYIKFKTVITNMIIFELF